MKELIASLLLGLLILAAFEAIHNEEMLKLQKQIVPCSLGGEG